LSGSYCAACGQKAVPLDVSLHHFLHEFVHETLHVDGRIYQSIRRLLMSPGYLTREYLQGRRAKWISPVRLYLIFSVAFFAISAFTTVRVTVRDRPRQSGWSFSIGNRAPIGITAESDEEANATAKQLGYASVDELHAALDHAWVTWTPRVMFVLVPLFAWLVAVAYRVVDRNYLHHLIFTFHVHAAWFAYAALAAAVSLVFARAGEFLNSVVLLYLPVYAFLALRRVYGGVRRSFLRVAFVLFTYWVVVTVAILVVVLPVVFDRVP
jgi:hypothetical protein